MRVLIIDDDKIKLTAILEAIQQVANNCSIDNATYGKEALRLMKEKRYDLLIIDLNLPFKEEDSPSEEGGKKVVNEIYRNIGRIYIPNYIVGLTQYAHFVNNYFNVWKVFHYRSNETGWIGNLKKLLSHITQVSYLQNEDQPELPTIIVEGETDYKFLNKAVDLFFPELNGSYKIIFSRGTGGANWVVNQSLIWMNSYHKNSDLKNVVAAAILDRDIAGINAAKSIQETFKSDKQREILKIYKLDERHSENVKIFFTIGCEIQFEIESMFNIEQIKYAEKQGWLDEEYTKLVKVPKEWDMYSESLTEYLLNKKINNDDLLYLKKVSWNAKEKFCNYILKIEDSKQKIVFKNFENILLDIFKKLGLK